MGIHDNKKVSLFFRNSLPIHIITYMNLNDITLDPLYLCLWFYPSPQLVTTDHRDLPRPSSKDLPVSILSTPFTRAHVESLGRYPDDG